MEKDIIKRFINEDGKITMLTKKRAVRYELLKYLAGKFEPDRIYTEHEVNAICDKWHTFNDLFILRRELIENKLLLRKTDGSEYWVNKTPKEQEIQ